MSETIEKMDSNVNNDFLYLMREDEETGEYKEINGRKIFVYKKDIIRRKLDLDRLKEKIERQNNPFKKMLDPLPYVDYEKYKQKLETCEKELFYQFIHVSKSFLNKTKEHPEWFYYMLWCMAHRDSCSGGIYWDLEYMFWTINMGKKKFDKEDVESVKTFVREMFDIELNDCMYEYEYHLYKDKKKHVMSRYMIPVSYSEILEKYAQGTCITFPIDVYNKLVNFKMNEYYNKKKENNHCEYKFDLFRLYCYLKLERLTFDGYSKMYKDATPNEIHQDRHFAYIGNKKNIMKDLDIKEAKLNALLNILEMNGICKVKKKSVCLFRKDGSHHNANFFIVCSCDELVKDCDDWIETVISSYNRKVDLMRNELKGTKIRDLRKLKYVLRI